MSFVRIWLKKAIHVDSIGGWSEHLHILIALGRDQDIAKVMMLIKGESSHWLNAQGFFRGKFFWQDDYFAVSVSESKVETHHQAVPFDRELASLQRVVRGDLSG
jgi:REP element-mobilizing transposase RayT